jgi:hypothetical protein
MEGDMSEPTPLKCAYTPLSEHCVWCEKPREMDAQFGETPCHSEEAKALLDSTRDQPVTTIFARAQAERDESYAAFARYDYAAGSKAVARQTLLAVAAGMKMAEAREGPGE